MSSNLHTQRQTTCRRCGTQAPASAAVCPVCGLALAATVLRPPSAAESTEMEMLRQLLADEYDVVGELGRGGMAIVFRAVERQLEREVAVKMLPLALAHDDGFVERFLREARTAAQLEHPHIIPIHRIGRTGRIIYFVMKYLRGGSLADRLRERGRLAPEEIRRLLVEVGGALGYAARREVVHRDIKPDNIMFDELGHCVVTDFGIAKSAAAQKLTGTGMSVGTPRYMSPEQARAKPTDGRSDIYSLGIVAYECLVGDAPFDGEDAFAVACQHITAPLPEPALASRAERELFEVIARMVAKDPDERIQGGEELLRALGAPLGAGLAPRAAPTLASTLPRVRRSLTNAARAISAGHALDAVRAQRPKVRAAAAAVLRLVAAQRLKVETGVRSATALAATQGAHGVRWARTRGRRFWLAVAVGLLAAAGARHAAHVALTHRSRCPAPAPADSAGGGGAIPAESLTVLLEPVGSVGVGSELDIYYDVCGLPRAAGYTAAVTVTRNERGLRRLFGAGPDPRARSFAERASGPATRRHRTLDLDGLPTGSYALDLTVTDADGRRRSRRHQFQIVE